MEDLGSRRDRRREQILVVAHEVFYQEGYAATSMSNLAARLGGSKGTLYNYFPSKEALFEACIRDQCARFSDSFLDPHDERPVEEALRGLGERYVEHLMSDWALRTFQIVVAESARTPDLARLFFEVGPAVGARRLRDYLARRTAEGALDIENPALAAGQFLSLCRGHRHLPCLLNLETRPSAAVVAEEVASATQMFLAAYRPKPGSGRPALSV
jgi:AcrR family transcriptional regulator